MHKTNIEHPTSNAERRNRGHATCSSIGVRCSMFSFLPMNDLKYAFGQLLKNQIHGLTEFSRKGCDCL